MGQADYDFVDSHNKRRHVDLISADTARPSRHRCENVNYPSDCPFHRRVWGDLVPVEQYRNGNTGRHHSPDDVPDMTEAHHI